MCVIASIIEGKRFYRQRVYYILLALCLFTWSIRMFPVEKRPRGSTSESVRDVTQLLMCIFGAYQLPGMWHIPFEDRTCTLKSPRCFLNFHPLPACVVNSL